MTMPQEYQRAQAEFDALLREIIDALDFATRNQAYTSLQAVLLVFRKRLTAEQVLRFAVLLPAILRALFIAGWHPGETEPGFPDRSRLEEEVRGVRKHHNFSPAETIGAVTAIIRKHISAQELETALAAFPPEARRFWGLPE